MPLYEYKCEGCGDVFEIRQKFADEPLTQHDKCGGRVHRVISAPALQFKGSGWYVTDYAKSGAAPKGEGKSGEKSDGKSEGTSESKTDSNGAKSTGSESKCSTESSTKSESSSDSKSASKSESSKSDSSTK